MSPHSESIPTDDDDDAEFIDALDEFTFPDSPNSEHSLPASNSNSSSVCNLHVSTHDSILKPPHTPDPQSSPSSAGLRRRRLLLRQNSKESGFKNSSDGSDVYTFLLNLNDNCKSNDKLNQPRVRASSGGGGKRLADETNQNPLNSLSSLDSNGTVTSSDETISDGAVTVNSPVTRSNLVFMLVRLILKAMSLQATVLVAFVTLPIWLAHSSYMFVTDPFAVIKRVKRYMIETVSRLLKFCLGNVKCVVCKIMRRNKSVTKWCLRVGWGVVWAVFVGVVLAGLLVFAFVVGAVVMKCIVEVPVRRVEQLSFDYTRGSPAAFVPLICPGRTCLECDGKIGFEDVGVSRVVPVGHKLQAAVLLTLPESDYNKNLGNFQVRVDFLSSNGKPLASAAQPCTMQFKSWPIHLLMTVFKLAPLITGYSSESQTLHIKFNGYTERETPTCGVRVALEPRAEFAKGGGVPELYAAYLKLESQLPLLQRILWSWKATVFVWISIMIFTLGSIFILLCCIPVFVPGVQLRRVPLNNTGSR